MIKQEDFKKNIENIINKYKYVILHNEATRNLITTDLNMLFDDLRDFQGMQRPSFKLDLSDDTINLAIKVPDYNVVFAVISKNAVISKKEQMNSTLFSDEAVAGFDKYMSEPAKSRILDGFGYDPKTERFSAKPRKTQTKRWEELEEGSGDASDMGIDSNLAVISANQVLYTDGCGNLEYTDASEFESLDAKVFIDAYHEAIKDQKEQLFDNCIEKAEIMAEQMIEDGSSNYVKAKLAHITVIAIRNLSMDEIEQIRNSEGDPFKFISFKNKEN